MARAIWGGKVLAESKNTVVVEGNHYFPAESVKPELFRAANAQYTCPWKGTCDYYDVVVNGLVNAQAAWVYPDPKPAAAEIKGHYAFWKGVRVEA